MRACPTRSFDEIDQQRRERQFGVISVGSTEVLAPLADAVDNDDRSCGEGHLCFGSQNWIAELSTGAPVAAASPNITAHVAERATRYREVTSQVERPEQR
jgi:hypothetical protein